MFQINKKWKQKENIYLKFNEMAKSSKSLNK